MKSKKELIKQFEITKKELGEKGNVRKSFLEMHKLMLQIYTYMEGNMDKKIRKIEKNVKHTEKDLKNLEKMDKKRDPACEMGKKMMKKKKKK